MGSSTRIGSATSCGRNVNPSSRMCSMFASEPLTRLSTQITRLPRSSRYSQRCEPRKPAPPVTSAVGTGAMLAGVVTVFVRLRVDALREQRELEPRDDEQRHEDDGRDGDRVACDPEADDDEPEAHAGDGGDEAHHVEEDERVEVALDVLLPEPPEEAAQQQP